MLVCYLDDSGESAEPIITCAGYLSTGDEWLRFEERAREYFDTRRQSPDDPIQPLHDLHTVDLRQRRGEWDGWSTLQTLAFARGLFKILAEHVVFGVEFSVLKTQFAEMKKDGLVPREGSPFAFCFKGVLSRILRTEELAGEFSEPEVDLSFVVERGHKNNCEVLQVFNRYQIRDPQRLRSLGFEDKTKLIALQVSDFIAHFARRVRNPPSPDAPSREGDLRFFKDAVGGIKHVHFLATDFTA